jgi:hypothetical protein
MMHNQCLLQAVFVKSQLQLEEYQKLHQIAPVKRAGGIFVAGTALKLQIVLSVHVSQFFVALLGVNSGRVNLVLRKQLSNGGVVIGDQRGRHERDVQRIPTCTREAVISHINSFPQNDSHYTKSHSDSRRFLSADLSVNKMYSMYFDRSKETNTEPVKLWYYRHLFNTEFNLSFNMPRNDTCKRCDISKVQRDAVRAEHDGVREQILEREHELHLRKAEAVRNCLQTAGVSEDHEVFSFDLQKVLSLPKLSTNEVYYCRQLSVCNLGIHSLVTGKSIMNVWDETVASRGSLEIGSRLLNYCLEKAASGITTVTTVSDACGGQNRNHKITLMWMHICQVSSIREINHKFMVSGHSYLPNDRDFGVIERATNKANELYVPEQWCQLIEKCNQKNPFEVKRMQQSMFVSVGEFSKFATVRKIQEPQETEVDGEDDGSFVWSSPVDTPVTTSNFRRVISGLGMEPNQQ